MLVEENHREPHVAVLVSYDIGARDEPAGYASLAHLVEHLTFRRSRHLTDYRGVELLERAGAEVMNGETHADRTLFYTVVPSKALPLALWLESERMGFTLETFDAEAVEHERGIIRAEVRSSLTGTAQLLAHTATALYGAGHPYASHADPVEDLDDLTLRDTQSFFQRGYRPDNAHLVIVGDVTLADGRALAERYFGGLANPKSARAARRPLTPASARRTRIHYRSPEYSSFLCVAYPAPARGTRAHVAAELLAFALRFILAHELAAVYVNVQLVDTAADSQFVIQATPRQGVTLRALEDALGTALATLTKERLVDALREARGGLIEREWLALENPLRRARDHVETLSLEGHPADTALRIHALAEATAADLAALLPSFAQPLVIAEKSHDRNVGFDGSVEVSTP